ncbi:hypothetical protein F183_A22900 [Bryobacterales bacterium F-183]|nr:hypothetical protein F183_A22900 [Bryobacterales bacterium F-183]
MEAEQVEAPDEKRKHPRFGVHTEARVSVLGSLDTAVAQILDLSQAGLKLLSPVSFPTGEIIRAEIDDEVFVVVVCYCKGSEEGFVLGTEMMHSIKRLHLDQLVSEWGVK